MFSLILGVSGLGIISQLLNFQTFAIFIVSVGIPLGFTKYISESKDDDKHLTNIIFLNSLRILTISSVIFAIIISILSKYISDFLFNDVNFYYFILILALFIPFSAFSGFLEAYLKGLRDISLLTKLLISAAVTGTFFTLIFLFLFGLNGAVIGSLSNSLISTVIYFVVMKKKLLIPKLKIFTSKSQSHFPLQYI